MGKKHFHFTIWINTEYYPFKKKTTIFFLDNKEQKKTIIPELGQIPNRRVKLEFFLSVFKLESSHSHEKIKAVIRIKTESDSKGGDAKH